MNWIVTADGHEASLEFPTHADYEIERIAHSLAQINRFNGHAARPYSVAEHSLLVLDIAKTKLGLDAHGQMAALMHDAHEAFVGDVTSPMKGLLGSAMCRLEMRHANLMSLRYGYHVAMTNNAMELKMADLMALAVERAALLPTKKPCGTPSTPWPCHDVVTSSRMNGTWDDLMGARRVTATWQTWRDRFIQAFQELQFERAELSHHRLGAGFAVGAN